MGGLLNLYDPLVGGFRLRTSKGGKGVSFHELLIGTVDHVRSPDWINLSLDVFMLVELGSWGRLLWGWLGLYDLVIGDSQDSVVVFGDVFSLLGYDPFNWVLLVVIVEKINSDRLFSPLVIRIGIRLLFRVRGAQTGWTQREVSAVHPVLQVTLQFDSSETLSYFSIVWLGGLSF